jgi:uncharacterized protein YjbI with pentapeptide repeats
LFAALSLSIATFPGEPHVNLATGHPAFSTQCDRWFAKTYDRLILRNVDVVDDEKLAKIVRATEEKEQMPHQGEATRKFSNRDLRCADLTNADFRHVDLKNADLSGARLDNIELQGTTLDDAQLSEATIANAKLSGASLVRANFRNADLTGAEMSKVRADSAKFHGALLSSVNLQEADLSNALFQAADVSFAQLQGASLYSARFQAASLEQADFQGAFLTLTKLQGATLTGSDFGGARLSQVQLQGAAMDQAKLTVAFVDKPFVWRTSSVSCDGAQITEPESNPFIDTNRDPDSSLSSIKATPASVRDFIVQVVASVPESKRAEANKLLEERLQGRIESEAANSASWLDCASRALSTEGHYEKLATYVVRQACSKAWNPYFGIDAIINSALSLEMGEDAPSSYFKTLARGLLGMDQAICKTPIQLTEKTKSRLMRVLNRPDSN